MDPEVDPPQISKTHPVARHPPISSDVKSLDTGLGGKRKTFVKKPGTRGTFFAQTISARTIPAFPEAVLTPKEGLLPEYHVMHSPQSATRDGPDGYRSWAEISSHYGTEQNDTASLYDPSDMQSEDLADAFTNFNNDLMAHAGLDMRLKSSQQQLFLYSAEDNEKMSREAFEKSGGFSMSERLLEKMQRLLQRYGKDVNRDATDTSAALGNVYGLQDLYKLSMSEAVIAFTSHEMNWLEKQLLAIHPESTLRQTQRTPEFFKTDALSSGGSEGSTTRKHYAFHKVYCVVSDVVKVVEALEVICARWNKPHSRVLFIEDFLITEQNYSGKSLKVRVMLEFFGITWKLRFTTQDIACLDRGGGRSAEKTIDFIQMQFLSAAIWNKPEKLRPLIELNAVKVVADPNVACDAMGMSGLHHAAVQGNMEITQLLINADANPWSQDSKCRPPLYYALRFGRRDVANYLMSLMESDKDSENNLTAICSCLEFDWDDQCPLIPSVVRIKRHIKARYIELIQEQRFSEFVQLAKFTRVTIEDSTVLRMMLPRAALTAGALLQALSVDASVDCSNLGLTGATIMELADALKSETPIGQLNLRHNTQLGTEPDVGIGLARIVSMATQLRVLILEDCGFTSQAFHRFVTRLDQQRSSLQVVSFKRNRFMGHESLSGIGFQSILRLRTLRQIDFSLCGWYSSAAESLSKRLSTNFFLRRLILDHNPYIGTSAVFGETLARILLRGRSLDHVSISGCDISSEVIIAMGEKLARSPDVAPQVRQIDFAKNIRLGDSPEAGVGLAILLHACECLTNINLSYVGLTPATMLKFGETLDALRARKVAEKMEKGAGRYSVDSTIASMDFGNNYKLGTSPESGTGIGYLLKNCSQLLEFNLAGCHLSPEAMQKLGESLEGKIIGVRNILWEGNWHIGSSPAGGRGLGLLLQHARALQEMDFSQCGLTSESLESLGDAIRENIDLTKITIHGNDAVGTKRNGGMGLGKLLLHARSLERFRFTQCNVNTEFIEGLRDSLSINVSSPPIISCKFLTLQTTHTTGMLSSTSMGQMLANLLMSARFLHSCELDRCQLDSVTLAKLGGSITQNIAMKKITFAKNDALGAFASGGTGIGQLVRKAVHLEDVSLRAAGFSPQATEALGIALEGSSLSLKLMDMSNNPRLGTAASAGRGIANLLKSCPQLELLNLTCCNFGSDGINRCSSIIRDNWSPLGVKRLNFQGNSQLAQLVDGGAALGSFLSAAYNMEWLNLSRCGLNSVAITSMVNHAHSFNALTFLDISESFPASQGSVNQFPASRKESFVPGGKPIGQFVNLGSRLKILRLSECGISSVEMLELGRVIRPNVLEDVDLSNNELGDRAEGGEGLGLFVQRSLKLVKLNLKHCSISFEAIKAMLNTRGFKEMPDLTTLLLTSNPLGGRKESGTLLGELLSKCPKLSVLEVRNCGLAAAALGDLGPAISRRAFSDQRGDREKAQLRIVDLSYNAALGDSPTIGKGLAGMINSLPTIFEINLTCCGLTTLALSVLLENLNDHRSKTITKLLFSGNYKLGQSPESGRVLFQLLLKFRVAYIDCSSCGITSDSVESLGNACDTWRSRAQNFMSKKERKSGSQLNPRSVTSSFHNLAGVTALDSIRDQRDVSETDTFDAMTSGRDLKLDRHEPSIQEGNQFSSSRFVRSVMMEPKLYAILQELDFSNNPDMLTTAEAGESMGKLLTFAEMIEVVKLSNCGINGQAIHGMADYVEQMHILHLDLSRNPSIATDQTGGNGLQTIFSNPKIEGIDLTDCAVPIKYSPTVW